MTDTRQAPAGWYSDPANPAGLRWWDGQAWGPTAPPNPTKNGKGFAVTSLTLGIVAFLLALLFGWDWAATILMITGSTFGIIGAAATRNLKGTRALYITALIINALALALIVWV